MCLSTLEVHSRAYVNITINHISHKYTRELVTEVLVLHYTSVYLHDLIHVILPFSLEAHLYSEVNSCHQ